MRDLAAVLRNRNLAVLLAGRLVSSTGDWLYAVALSVAVYGYSHRSAFAVGLLWVVRLVPYMFLSPFAGALSDRIGHRRTMVVADVGRMIIVAALASLLSSSTWIIMFPLVCAVSSLNAVFRPANTALIPLLVESKEQRLAANATVMQIESIASIAGSALGGVLAGAGQVKLLLLIEAATFGVSALSLGLIRLRARAAQAMGAEQTEQAAPGMIAGFRALAGRPLLLFAATIMALPELASGALVVWIVPYAVQTLHLGNAGVGYLYSAQGLGAVAGGLVAALIGSSVRLEYLLAGSIAVGGVSLALFGIAPVAVAAVVFLVITTIAETVEYAAFETLLQRAAPENMIGQAAGTLDAFLVTLMLVGNVLSGLLAAWLGLAESIAGLGILVVVAAGLSLWQLRRTAWQPDAATLAAIPLFANLPESVRDWTLDRMVRERFPAGAVVVRQGDSGDTFYAISHGTAQVEVSLDGTIQTHELVPGQFFGEIALLQGGPRTATVRAVSPLVLYTITRADLEDLLARASELKESLLEAANARLERDSALRLTLSTRT
jgi:MFS family permease